MTKKIIIIVLTIFIVFGVGFFVSKQYSKDNTVNTSKPASSGVTLDLSGQQLTRLPSSFLNQTNITVLNLSNNQLTSLPPSITSLVNLEVINVENNRLESLPSEINQLKNLHEIHANNNRMTSLPSTLGTMTWLTSIDISGNNIPQSDIAQLNAKLTQTQIKN